MNTNTTTRKIRTATLVSAIAALATMVASPAMAQHLRDDGPAGASGAGALGYGTALSALDGQSLAQYLQQHQASDPRISTVV